MSGMRMTRRALSLPPHNYAGKPEPHRRRGYALIGPHGAVVGGPYGTTADANTAKRLFHQDAEIELVEVTH